MERNIAIRIMTLLTALLSLAACTDEQDNGCQATLTLLPQTALPVEVQTRTDYAAPTETLPVGLFIVPLSEFDNTNYAPTVTSFRYDTSITGWKSNYILNEKGYKFFGYYPVDDDVTASFAYNGTATDPVMTISGLDAMTPRDVSVIIGIGGGDNETNARSAFETGNYDYTTRPLDKNYVYARMDHLCSRIHLNFTIGAAYAEVRRIEILEVKLQTTVHKYNITVTLHPDTSNSPTVTYNSTETASGDAVLFQAGAGAGQFLSSVPLVLDGFCVPPTVSGSNEATLITTYNVYDKTNDTTPVRANQTVQNKLTLPEELTVGNQYTIHAIVAPTYLYQLSDNDLNNPSITFE